MIIWPNMMMFKSRSKPKRFGSRMLSFVLTKTRKAQLGAFLKPQLKHFQRLKNFGSLGSIWNLTQPMFFSKQCKSLVKKFSSWNIPSISGSIFTVHRTLSRFWKRNTKFWILKIFSLPFRKCIENKNNSQMPKKLLRNI